MQDMLAPSLSPLIQLLAPTTVTGFILFLTRVSGLMVAAPFFSNHGVPHQVKIFVAVSLSLLLFPLFSQAQGTILPQHMGQMLWLGMQEFLIGLIMGFVAELLMHAVRMTGDVVSLQMGLSMSMIMDPASGRQNNLMGQLYFYAAMMLFLSLNLHHALIAGLVKSFQAIPLGVGFLTQGHFGLLIERLLAMSGHAFQVALLVGMPVFALLLCMELASAFVAKTMPQMNLFMVAMPLKPLVGLVAVAMGLPLVNQVLGKEYALLTQHLFGLFRGIG